MLLAVLVCKINAYGDSFALDGFQYEVVKNNAIKITRYNSVDAIIGQKDTFHIATSITYKGKSYKVICIGEYNQDIKVETFPSRLLQ